MEQKEVKVIEIKPDMRYRDVEVVLSFAESYCITDNKAYLGRGEARQLYSHLRDMFGGEEKKMDIRNLQIAFKSEIDHAIAEENEDRDRNSGYLNTGMLIAYERFEKVINTNNL